MSGYKIYVEKKFGEIEKILEKNTKYQCLQGFVNYMEDLSAVSIKNYLTIVVRFLKYTDKEIENLSFDDYTEFMAVQKNKGSSMRITCYFALKRFSKYLRISRRNTSDPMQDIPVPKKTESLETREKREKGYLTIYEVRQVLNQIPENGLGIRDKAIIMLFLCTGLRCSAVYRLDIDSIDAKQATVRTIEKGNKVQEYKLTDKSLEYLNRWVEERKNYAKENEEALFVNRWGERISQNGLAMIVKKYPTTAGKKVSPHKLRATYGTRLLEQTHDIYFVQKCMGHANPITTELYIRGRKQKERERAAEILEEIY